MTRRWRSTACDRIHASIEEAPTAAGQAAQLRRGFAAREEQLMTDDLRDCPGCGAERMFVLRHPEPGCCPDSADGWCPERFCTGCGTALLAAKLPFGRDLDITAQLDRVA